jgi:hypothetical protein
MSIVSIKKEDMDDLRDGNKCNIEYGCLKKATHTMTPTQEKERKLF